MRESNETAYQMPITKRQPRQNKTISRTHHIQQTYESRKFTLRSSRIITDNSPLLWQKIPPPSWVIPRLKKAANPYVRFVLPTHGKMSSHSAFRFPYNISSLFNFAAVWARFKLMAQRALRARPLTCWSHERKNLIWKTVQLLITLRPRPLRTLQLSSRIVTENVRLLRQKIQPPSWIIIPS